jgi:two-component system, OmpR family, sensor histidine kinase KdpD
MGPARRGLRLLISVAGVAVVTLVGYRLTDVNATTVGFAYLLLILVIASTWGFVEALTASLLATLVFNFFFFPPVGTFTIADPQNWVSLFSFLATSVIASRLSAKAKRRALDAIERRQDVERLYTFSRAILLIGGPEAFPKQLVAKLAEIFECEAAVLFERRTGEFYRAGPADFDGLDEQLRDAALNGTTFSDPPRRRTILSVRLGAEPIASLALQGSPMPDAVMQGIANLVAIGLERSRAQDLAHEVEAARQAEELRTTLIDAMAHQFKTPLTSVRAATSSLLADPEQARETRLELLAVADEEAEHLGELIDDAVEMARLDAAKIDLHLEATDLAELVQSVADAEAGNRKIDVSCDDALPPVRVDRRLVKLALEQLADNAIKYSPPGTAVAIRLRRTESGAAIDVTDQGKGISEREQARIFDRFYRGPSVRQQIPGSGLGLSIAHRIARAHEGDLTVASRPGETTFRLTLPMESKGRRQ